MKEQDLRDISIDDQIDTNEESIRNRLEQRLRELKRVKTSE